MRDALTTLSSSIFLRRIIGPMFMRVDSKFAHQLRPPLRVWVRAMEAAGRAPGVLGAPLSYPANFVGWSDQDVLK
jgi:hypothetical protein